MPTRKATGESKEVAVSSIQTAIANAPSFIQDSGDVGNENVGSEDLVIPRLMLLQDLSPEVKKSNSKYVEGAEPGKILNTLTKELYDEVRLINLHQNREFPVFVKRAAGGGFRGSKSSREEAQDFVNSSPDKGNLEIVETVSHFCLQIDDDGNPVGEVIIPMTSTKIGFSRQWNSMIKLRKGPRFGTIWTLTSLVQANKHAQEFYNYTISAPGEWITDEALFNIAKEKHEIVKHMSGIGTPAAPASDE